jgi:nitroreductase
LIAWFFEVSLINDTSNLYLGNGGFMDVMEAIHGRLSTSRMAPGSVSRELIEKLLGAAVQAPNHYKVRPWRFVVLIGDGRVRLGNLMADIFHQRFPDAKADALDKERVKPLRSPIIIAVGVDKPAESKVLEVENICAAAAACQNILLAAHALGLGSHWRTGDAARDPQVKNFLGFSEDQNLIGFLYIGYPESQAEPPQRPGFEDRTIWIE